ncbi:MAG: hypothetical protein ACPLKS_06965 [Caldisericum exile]|uniref:hypothetical protein n=1 Tax=Caldisericum exile TaxID=693075 RepID=UPI003C716BA2
MDQVRHVCVRIPACPLEAGRRTGRKGNGFIKVTLKFYYGVMLERKFIYEVKRSHKDKKLPIVLSKEEVAKILSSVDNIKHKAILMLTYSAGLRVS